MDPHTKGRSTGMGENFTKRQFLIKKADATFV